MNNISAAELRIKLSEKSIEINNLEDEIAAATHRPTVIGLLGKYADLSLEYYTLMDHLTKAECAEWRKKSFVYRLFHKN